MRSADLIRQEKETARQAFMQALRDNDTEKFGTAFEQLMRLNGDEVRAEFEQLRNETDTRVLVSRGVRQLTSEESNYYQKFAEAARTQNPAQALAGLDVVLPKTVVDSTLEELQTEHPLLSEIDFMPTTGVVEIYENTDGEQKAVWGGLTSKIVQEITSGFKKSDATLLKLSAFIPIAKSMLDLGPAWLDMYIRRILLEALANGLEYGCIDGTGKDEPIGMTRQVGDNVTITGGVYPRKATVKTNSLDPVTVGKLLSMMAVNANGKPRKVSNVVLLVNPQDYLQTIMPATTIMAPDGTYRNDVLPYPMKVVQTNALQRGTAVLGLSKKYFAGVGMEKSGRIEYDDSYRFLEDERVYLIKLYANGHPKDNNAFLVLDISDMQPLAYKVVAVDERVKSKDAALTSLSLGSATLSPAFAAETTTYTASTANASNTINAVPADAGAQIEIKLGDKVMENGAQLTWADGTNTVTVKVTAEDGTTTKAYTVTVTKA